ncbi:TonB-dependent receptor domain-containing protein [Pleionea litopenaei]|uniref:TonB-dependent receptor n=1 Tax=Pleionea litopenaei TaxID=3070815 RepID=A0AA51RS94_9GAMM|nr:TonB-dependent receptor [Pleionea sp. HL-JVS1]WMS86554.1 TonB-dependent receptor [Pleionea sp. HL-JVS1]
MKSRVHLAVVTALVVGAYAKADDQLSVEQKLSLSQASLSDISIFTKDDIQAKGVNSIAEFLHQLPQNNFGSYRPISGRNATISSVNLRGVGSNRTLVLLDGRRLPESMQTGNGQDLNSIPLAAVERIEVLPRSASAQFGSGAIGGVVNIITRADFDGVELSYSLGDSSTGDSGIERASAIFGSSSAKVKLVGGISLNKRDEIYRKDVTWSTEETSSFSNNFYQANLNPGSYYGYTQGPAYFHPTYGNSVPQACSELSDSFTVVGGRCFYNVNNDMMLEPSLNNYSLFANASYRINEQWQVYFNSGVSRVESFDQLAPTPSTPWVGGSVFIPTTSPNHPANQGFVGYDGNSPLFLRHRFVGLGNRKLFLEENQYRVTLGAEADLNSWHFDFGIRRHESKGTRLGLNYVVTSSAQAAIESGEYNIYDPLSSDPAVLDSIKATINRDMLSSIDELYLSAEWQGFAMNGGDAVVSFDIEQRKEEYQDLYDTLSASGQISGSSGSNALGSRDLTAFAVSVYLPFSDKLTVQSSLRQEKYTGVDAETAVKLAASYLISDEWRLSAQWSSDFRAPDMRSTTLAPSYSLTQVNDPDSCLLGGFPGNCFVPAAAYQVQNPNLAAETSDDLSLTLEYDLNDSIQIKLSAWNLSIDNKHTYIGAQQVIDCVRIPTCQYATNLPTNLSSPNAALGIGVSRDSNGFLTLVQNGVVNLGDSDVAGFDFSINGEANFSEYGSLSSKFTYSEVSQYENDGVDQVGKVGNPDYRIQWNNRWLIGDYSVNYTLNHIAKTNSTWFDLYAPAYASYGYSAAIDSWTTHDLQLSWNTPWNGQLAIGVNNLSDEEPSIDPLLSEQYLVNLHNPYGRTTYVQYKQSF